MNIASESVEQHLPPPMNDVHNAKVVENKIEEKTKNTNTGSTEMELEEEGKEDGVHSGNVKIQIELLEKQNKDLIKEQVILKKEIENLNLFKVITNNFIFFKCNLEQL